MRQQAVASQEERITETRRAVVQEDLSQTRIIQPEGTHRSQQVISDIVRRNVEKLHLLYTRQLQARPDLQGFATVEFVISSQGKVSSCRLVTSTLSDPVFEEAIVQEILRWQFPTAERGITTVLYPLSFLPAG
ncbi:MAG: AgmX/PglI C-terminal domain-containing protein [Candidatus Manganitrophaceae bacterium]